MWAILWQFREDGWHFRRQQPIGPYYADFACMHAKVVIEVDGATHVDADRDARRDEYMRSRGIQVLRFANDEVLTNADGVYTVIGGVLAAISSASNTPHPVPPPQGGRRRRNRQSESSPAPTGHASVGSPSPLPRGDGGRGTLPALREDEGR
jgi:very-short-patch-repair endonuclease